MARSTACSPSTQRAARLRHLLHDCVGSTATDQGNRIREAALALSALQARPVPVDHARLEAMLAAGAYESAVLLVLGEQTGFILSRGGDGTCLASRLRTDGETEIMAEAATLALALLAAELSVMLADAEGAGPDGIGLQESRPPRFH